MPSPKLTRYFPPTRTSISHARMVMPSDFGTHHFMKSSGRVHAWYTSRAGASKVRRMTSSRSDLRSTGCFAGLLSLFASIGLLLAFQFFDDLVQRLEARVPELPEPLHPGGLLLEPARADPAG